MKVYNLSLLLILLPLFLLFFSSSCKNKNSTEEKMQSEETESEADPLFPILSEDEFMNLYQQADAIDFIFHNLPFSVNQTDQASVKNTISGFTKIPVTRNDCTSMGRMFFQIGGEITMEAEIYYNSDEGCRHYVFYQDGEPRYACGMSDASANFYQTLINNASQQQ